MTWTIIAQQARLLAEMIDVCLQHEAEAQAARAQVCPHPSDKIITVGTMGRSTRICGDCKTTIPNEEAAT